MRPSIHPAQPPGLSRVTRSSVFGSTRSPAGPSSARRCNGKQFSGSGPLGPFGISTTLPSLSRISARVQYSATQKDTQASSRASRSTAKGCKEHYAQTHNKRTKRYTSSTDKILNLTQVGRDIKIEITRARARAGRGRVKVYLPAYAVDRKR